VRRLIPLVVGVLGGLLGVASGLPAGALLGSLGAVVVYTMVGGQVGAPRWLRLPSRALMGAAIGSLVTPALLGILVRSLGWTIVVTVALVGCSLALGLLFARLARVDAATGVLAACPGGIAEMTALSQDVGARTDVVLGVHMARKFVLLAAVITVATRLG
jgi:membrane AbrB-like protein